MNLWAGEKIVNRSAKRLLTILGAVVVGVLATATPALACHPIITGTAVCQANGTYDITWSVGNGDWGDHWQQKIIDMTPNPAGAINGFAVNTMIDINSHVDGHQIVPGSTTHASLWVKSQWYSSDGKDATNEIQERTGDATGLTGDCTPEPEPSATFVSKCDGTVNVHITNPGRTEAIFHVAGTGFSQNVTIPAGGEKDVTVPAGAGAITVTMGEKKVGDFGGWSRPETCPGPTSIGESTCDGFWVKITNPQGGMPVDATVTYGAQTKTVTVAPGTTQAVSLTPGTQTEAGISYTNGWASQKASYTKPGDCPTLPKTGANTGTYIGTGIGLIAAGAIVFLLARRRLVQLRRMAA
jgi:LPXTG-motif cell wall-anchored protein